MRLGRLFLFSLVLAALCAAAFWLLVPGLQNKEPPFFDLRMAGYGDLSAVRDYLVFLETSGQINAFQTFYRWIDFVFPLAIFGMLTTAMLGFWARPAKSIAFLGVLVCIGFLVADYVENLSVAALLDAGSAGVTLDLINTASSATQGKWVAVLASLGLIALGFLVTLFRGGRR
jgi:hypothetical protein